MQGTYALNTSVNNLTDDIVNSSTVLSFKTMYDRFMGDQKYHTGDIY